MRADCLMLGGPLCPAPLPRVERVGGAQAPAVFSVLRLALSLAPSRAHHVLRSAARVVLGSAPDLVFRYPDGRAFLLPGGDRAYVSVLTLGAYEPVETHIVQQLLKRGDFAIDIGANYGWFSSVMASAVTPGGYVWAVEPTPLALRALEQNVELNPHLPIRVIPIALDRTPGRVHIHVFNGLPTGHSSVSTLGRDDFDVYECETRTLDLLLSDAARPPVLVKLDVEGSELAILDGSIETLRSATPPMWLTEVNYETARAFGYRPAELLKRLGRVCNYRVFRVEASGLVAEHDAERAPNGSCWLCVPPTHLDRLPRSLMT